MTLGDRITLAVGVGAAALLAYVVWAVATVIRIAVRSVPIILIVLAALLVAVWMGGPVLHAHRHAHGG